MCHFTASFLGRSWKFHRFLCMLEFKTSFCKLWLEATFLLQTLQLLNLTAKCFDESGENLPGALLISLGSLHGH